MIQEEVTTMLHNYRSSHFVQRNEYHKFAARAITYCMLFTIIELIVVSTGIMGVKVSQLLISILIFNVITSCLVAALWFFNPINSWAKYALIVVLSLGISGLNIFCGINDLSVIWFYPVVIASLFVSTRAIWFSMFFQLISLIISDCIAVTYFPQNYDLSMPWFALVISKAIQFVIVSLIFITINYRISDLVEKTKKSEEDKNGTQDKLKGVLKESSNLLNSLKDWVSQISDTVNQSKELNEKIAIGEEQIRADYENALKDMDYAFKAAESIAEKQLQIYEKSSTIADIFNQEDTMNDSVKVIIDNVIKQMQSIENSSKEDMEIIKVIHKKSLQVMNTLSLIEGTVKKIGSLSLNAYIEASRAGSFQNGFEVVAYDIKKLGERAEKETQMILSLMQDTVSDIEFAHKSIKDDIKGIKAGQDTVQKVEQLFAKASSENKKVNQNIKDINDKIKFSPNSNTNIDVLIKPIKEFNDESAKEIKGFSEITCEQFEFFDEFTDVLKSLEQIGEELKSIIDSD